MQGLLILLLEGLAFVVLVGAWLFYARLRRPPRRTYASAVSRAEAGDPSELADARAFEEWKARAPRAEHELPVWDIAGDDPSGPAVILTPGWGDSRIGALTRLPALLPVCSRVLAWDPEGLGESPAASRCALGTREDGALLELVKIASRDGAGARGVVLYGWSLGAGVSIVCAAREDARGLPIRAVIAEAPYRMPWTPAFRVMDLAGYPWRVTGPIAFALLGLRLGQGLRWRRFDRAAHASRVPVPLLVLHGGMDEMSPVEDGRAIAARATKGMIEVIDGGAHNDLWINPAHAAQCAEAVRRFMKED